MSWYYAFMICAVTGAFLWASAFVLLAWVYLINPFLYATGRLGFMWLMTIEKSMWIREPWWPIRWWLFGFKQAIKNPMDGLQSDEWEWRPYFKFKRRNQT